MKWLKIIKDTFTDWQWPWEKGALQPLPIKEPKPKYLYDSESDYIGNTMIGLVKHTGVTFSKGFAETVKGTPAVGLVALALVILFIKGRR